MTRGIAFLGNDGSSQRACMIALFAASHESWIKLRPSPTMLLIEMKSPFSKTAFSLFDNYDSEKGWMSMVL